LGGAQFRDFHTLHANEQKGPAQALAFISLRSSLDPEPISFYLCGGVFVRENNPGEMYRHFVAGPLRLEKTL